MRPEGDEEHRFSLRKLGNIHLGVRVHRTGTRHNGETYEYDRPMSTGYFVLPDSLREDAHFRAKLESMGQDPDRPSKLPIMLAGNDFATNIITSRDLYTQDGKLKCRSLDGLRCIRLNEKTFHYDAHECPEGCRDQKRALRLVSPLPLHAPDAAGIGCWQIVTRSDNNHGALLREMKDLRNLRNGQIAGLDPCLYSPMSAHFTCRWRKMELRS